MEKSKIRHNRLWFVILIMFSFLFLFLYAYDYSPFSNDYETNGLASKLKHSANAFSTQKSNYNSLDDSDPKSYSDSCSGRYIYVHDLPRRFNDLVVENCTALYRFYDMCPFLTNSGFGVKVTEGIISGRNWFATNQFLLEVIFRTRMNNYECLTNDSSLASAIFVPYYGGLDVGRYLWDYNISRDTLGADLVKWLAQKPEWKKLLGRDHFFVSGRIGWDFRRHVDNDNGWGSNLMSLPESMNMTMLTIESTAWSNEFAVPYPTHFHPSSETEVIEWQNKMRKQKRHYLFSFAGAPRPFLQDSIRSEIINQCLGSKRLCKLLNCDSGPNKCDNPVEVIKVFQDSVFCLQPPGDSYTRRSTFDSIVAGCIPVFFHPGSAYAQYEWYLPNDYTTYSVFIPGNLVKNGSISINETLLQVPNDKITKMRGEVIKLIPNILYANPKSKLESLEDAFDIAIKGVLARVEKVRKEIREGKDPGIGFAEPNWKLKFSRMGQQDWSRFF
ncbi:Xyloglucan galactosyltransferase KATAMARI1, putative [Ricinus communis]|uniref:Xyloglucan galactosyltransferase KATAMARI1, putative n=1 Tax=Ricinus communis TaxID=3988 RepID=B9RXY7_RICCO|nr:Xyloglucan galactosyltransferase KATAMARI1, putative [Ricinus communis]|eukprot:XP_025013004.1 probable xyloglucan galactosyltransferase GT14 [Ricinus communis]